MKNDFFSTESNISENVTSFESDMLASDNSTSIEMTQLDLFTTVFEPLLLIIILVLLILPFLLFLVLKIEFVVSIQQNTIMIVQAIVRSIVYFKNSYLFRNSRKDDDYNTLSSSFIDDDNNEFDLKFDIFTESQKPLFNCSTNLVEMKFDHKSIDFKVNQDSNRSQQIENNQFEKNDIIPSDQTYEIFEGVQDSIAAIKQNFLKNEIVHETSLNKNDLLPNGIIFIGEKNIYI